MSIVKCKDCSKVPVANCLITGNLVDGYNYYPLCSKHDSSICALDLWDSNQLVDIINLHEFEKYLEYEGTLWGESKDYGVDFLFCQSKVITITTKTN